MNQVALKPEAEVISTITPMEMLAHAVEHGASVETLEKLMGLAERYEANQARRAFANAMASAKAEIPVIGKNREVDFTSSKGRTNYQHEDLAEIARVVTPILAKHGLSYRYRTSSDIGQPVCVTCVVCHRDGYSEENSLSGPRDESGNKNTIQSIGSTITYLQRYTLKAALGLAASHDDDAARAEAPPAPVITAQQVDAIEDLLAATNSDRKQFLAYAKAPSVEAIPAASFDHLMTRLEAKAKKGAA